MAKAPDSKYKYFTTASAIIKQVREIKGKEAQEIIGKNRKLWLNAAKASNIVTSDQQPEQADLLYVDSVLVSSGMNKNTDVFLPQELWAAIPSIPNKPVDWNHDPSVIIGHMTEAFPVTKEGNLITGSKHLSPSGSLHPSPSGSLPASFDVVNKKVVYKWLFPDKAQQIIEGAKANELFVSMEVWFTDYDYLLGEDIVKRSSETDFLDAHLRQNGGAGLFDGKILGRVLRNMIFGGVGFVGNPANPASVIRDTQGAWIISPNTAFIPYISTNSPPLVLWPNPQELPTGGQGNGVKTIDEQNTSEDKDMDEVTDLKSQLAELTKQLEEANEKIRENESADTVKAINDLKSQVTAKDDEIKGLNEKVEALNETAEAHKECEAQVKDLEDKLAKSVETLAEIVKQANLEKRTETLKDEFGMDDEKAKSVLEKPAVSDLNDEDFASWVTERKEIAELYHTKQASASGNGDGNDDDNANANASDTVANALENANEDRNVVVPSTSGDGADAGVTKEIATYLGFEDND